MVPSDNTLEILQKMYILAKYKFHNWFKKNKFFQIVVMEKTPESPLDSKEIKPVNPKGNQPWIFIGRTAVEALVLWSPDAKSWLIGKDPNIEKDWGQEEKETTEDEMVGWHHWLNGHEFEQNLGNGEGQGSPAYCCPWVAKSQTQLLATEQQHGASSIQ